MGDRPHVTPSSARAITRRRTEGQSGSGCPGSHAPIRTERPTLVPGQNKTIRPRNGTRNRTLRDRTLNRETPNNRPTLPTIPQRTAHHPPQSVERGDHDSQTSPEDGDTRVDDKPLHREIEETGASITTTTRKPAPGAHTARIIERTRKRNAIAETHFQSNLSSWVGWYIACRTVLDDINAVLPQHTPNLLNIIHIHTSNANAALDLTIIVLNNFELKRDTVQPKNDLSAQ